MIRNNYPHKSKKIEYRMFSAYLLLLFLVMIWRGLPFRFDNLAILLLVVAISLGKTKSFLVDWTPFILLICAYDFLRGFADDLSTKVNITNVISWEKKLFGHIPTINYQQMLFSGEVRWYDFLLTIFYLTHFFFPILFGAIFWLDSREKFKKFTRALLLLSFSAFATFLFFPDAPPWLASKNGFLPEIERVILKVFALPIFGKQLGLPTLYTFMNPNPVAAIPSLHAGYPFLIFLFLTDYYPKKAFWFLPVFLVIAFTIVYFGEHYVVDVFIGMVYAFIAFLVTKHWHKKLNSSKNHR